MIGLDPSCTFLTVKQVLFLGPSHAFNLETVSFEPPLQPYSFAVNRTLIPSLRRRWIATDIDLTRRQYRGNENARKNSTYHFGCASPLSASQKHVEWCALASWAIRLLGCRLMHKYQIRRHADSKHRQGELQARQHAARLVPAFTFRSSIGAPIGSDAELGCLSFLFCW